MSRPPHYVHDFDQYWTWLETEVTALGGHFEHGALMAAEVLDPVGNVLALNVLRQRVYFYDGTFLEMDFAVDENFLADEYNFHFQHLTDGMIWRKDKHSGNPAGLTHIHYRLNSHEAEPYKEVDLGEALDEVRQYQSDAHTLWR